VKKPRSSGSFWDLSGQMNANIAVQIPAARKLPFSQEIHDQKLSTANLSYNFVSPTPAAKPAPSSVIKMMQVGAFSVSRLLCHGVKAGFSRNSDGI